jgi:hypothetical protein
MKMLSSFAKLASVSVLTACVLSGCFFLSGSSYSLRPYQVSILPDAQIRGFSIEVDLIGVNAANLAEYQAYPVDDYFKPDNSMRKGAAKYTARLTNGRFAPLSSSDPIWSDWAQRQATHLVVIANLPGQQPKGFSDPRRKTIQLNAKWTNMKNNTIELSLKEDHIELMTFSK